MALAGFMACLRNDTSGFCLRANNPGRENKVRKKNKRPVVSCREEKKKAAGEGSTPVDLIFC
jgi:hypothetical protein